MGFGDTDVIVGPAGATFTYTMPLVFPSEPSALTVIPLAGIVAGAVYRPPVVILPFVAFPPVTPLTCHVTALFVRPVTIAVY